VPYTLSDDELKEAHDDKNDVGKSMKEKEEVRRNKPKKKHDMHADGVDNFKCKFLMQRKKG